MDELVAGHLAGEPGTPVAENAALTVQVDVVVDGDGLLEVALLLDEAALSGAEGHGLVLERALPTFVADRAVQRVVDEEELQHPILGLAGSVGTGFHRHAWGTPDDAGGL